MTRQNSNKMPSRYASKIGRMLPQTERMLRDFFAPFNQQLADVIGDDRFRFEGQSLQFLQVPCIFCLPYEEEPHALIIVGFRTRGFLPKIYQYLISVKCKKSKSVCRRIFIYLVNAIYRYMSINLLLYQCSCSIFSKLYVLSTIRYTLVQVYRCIVRRGVFVKNQYRFFSKHTANDITGTFMYMYMYCTDVDGWWSLSKSFVALGSNFTKHSA